MKTIKSSKEISSIFSEGKRIGCPYATLLVRDSGSRSSGNNEQHGHQGRVAFIAGKKHGNAVWRNTAKRRLRSICRDLGGPWAGYDVLLVARAPLNEAKYSTVINACRTMFAKANIHVES